jgi:hypothetical protein
MRKIVFAALFATVSGITGASLAPAAFAQSGQCCKWTSSDGTCKMWGSCGGVAGGQACKWTSSSGTCKMWGSPGGQFGGQCCKWTSSNGTCKMWGSC